MACGIYKIANTNTGDFYIGKSKDIRKRKYGHLFTLKRGTHGSVTMQNGWNECGGRGFLFETIIVCETWELDRYEDAIIKKEMPAYNTMLTGVRTRHYYSPRTWE